MFFKKFLISLLVINVFILSFRSYSYAVENCDLNKCDSNSENFEYCLLEMDKICSKQKGTLSNEIKSLDSQYKLLLLKITQTNIKITNLEKEIIDINVELEKLEKKMNQESSDFIQQIIKNYKLQKKYPIFSYLFSDNINTFLEEYQYITSIQNNSRQKLIEMETTRLEYDFQKTYKVNKQIEYEELQKKQTSQKNDLNNNKIAKSRLLKLTEEEYQKIQQQIAALRSFSSSAGGSTCLDSTPGDGSDGNFYSQRDPRWCKKYIGVSNDTVGSVGCYISSISMVFKKLGYDTTPMIYASNPNNFSGNTAYMSIPSAPSGYNYKQTSYSTSLIDNELNAGRYVIAQMKMKNIAGMHFIVIIGGSNGNYKIHDPWFGADLNFSDRYSPALVMSLRLITK